MRKTTVLAAFVCLGLSDVSLAQEKPAAPAPQKGKGTESERPPATVLTGTVTLVDAKAGRLTLKTKDKEIKLTTDSQSTKSALAKLKIGDTAKVFERGGTVIAVSSVPTESSKTAK